MNSIYCADICKSQSRLFIYASKQGFDMEEFACNFMNSELANLEMDSAYYAYSVSDGRELMSFLIEEGLHFHPTKKQVGLLSDSEIAGWVGHMYRLLAIRKGVHSRQVYNALPYNKMVQLWVGGHTMDDESFVDTICL